MRAACEQVIERLDPVVGDDDLIRHVVLPQRPKGEELIVRVVLYKEDDPVAHHAPNPSAAAVFRYGMSLALRLRHAVLLSCPRCRGNGTRRPGSPCKQRSNRG